MPKYFTKDGLEKLKQELKYLKTVKQKEIVQQIKQAVSFGDLSENAAYHEAKNAQAFLRGRVLELEKMLVNAKIIEEDKNAGTVQLGSHVVVSQDKEKITLEIVGPEEANAMKGKISHQSPLGKALCGKSQGDTVEIKSPTEDGSIIKYEIISTT